MIFVLFCLPPCLLACYFLCSYIQTPLDTSEFSLAIASSARQSDHPRPWPQLTLTSRQPLAQRVGWHQGPSCLFPTHRNWHEDRIWESVLRNFKSNLMTTESTIKDWGLQVGCMRRLLRAGALGRPGGMGWRGRQEGGSGWWTHVNPWLIHVNVWQKPLQCCKVISLQWIKINGKKIN